MRTTVKGLGDIGLVTDRDAHDAPPNAWDGLQNVRCRRGRIEPVDGTLEITAWSNTGTQEVYAHQLLSLQIGSVFNWIYPYDADGDGIAERIYKYNGSSTDDITRVGGSYTGTISDLWQVTNANGMAILNNGRDAPQWWNGLSANCGDLIYDGSSAWGAFDTDNGGGPNAYAAKVIRSFKVFLFALNITEGTQNYPQMVHWSNPAEPGAIPDSWDYRSATNDSNRVVLAETDGHVLDALTLGDQLFIYKEDAIYRCAFVGGQFVFDFELVTTSHGLWSTNCVVDIGTRHVCLGDGVVYVHSGGTPQNILEGRAADRLFDSIDSAAYQKCFLTHYKPRNEVWICYPEVGETWANKALIWNYADNTWYERDIPKSSTIKQGVVEIITGQTWNEYTTETWADLERPWSERPYSPVGDTQVSASDQLAMYGEGITADMVMATKTDLQLGDPDTWHMIRKLMPLVDGDSVDIEIGTQEAIGAPVVWSTKQTFVPGQNHKLDFRESGKVHALRISGNSRWQMSGYALDATKVGQR